MRDAILGIGLLVISSLGCQTSRTFSEGAEGGAAGDGAEKTDAGEGSGLGGGASTGGAPDTTGPNTEGPDEGSAAAGGVGGAGDAEGLAGAAGAPDTDGTTICTADEYDDGAGCQPLTICGDDEFEQSPAGPDQDRVCAKVVQCAEAEFEVAPPTATSNRQCSPLTICAAGTSVASQPTDVSDRTCTDCPANSFNSTMNAATCTAWSSCGPGETESVPPSRTSDRVCSSCGAGKYEAAGVCLLLTVCKGSEYEETPATATSDRKCKPVRTCQPGSRQTAAPTATTDRQCAPCSNGTYSDQVNAVACLPWTRCGSDEYEVDAPDLTLDRVCDSLTTCHSGTHIEVAATATSDRQCEACANGTFTAAPNLAQCQAWRDCSAGSRATQGSASHDRACTACEHGTFSTTTNAASCTAWTTCGPNQNQTVEGTATSDVVCVDKPICDTADDRVCTVECPCASGEGVCTNSNQCESGASCVGDGGKKFGRSGATCIATHCDNDKKDAGETSVDCGGDCGCRASFEFVTYKGVPDGARFNGLTGMSGDGTRFSGGFNVIGQGPGSPAAVAFDGTVTELEQHGTTNGGTTAISADGNVIIGRMGCANPPQCTDTSWSEVRWVGSAGPEVLVSTYWGTVTHASASGALVLGFYYDEQAGGSRGFIVNDNQLTFVPAVIGDSNFFGMSQDGKYVAGSLVAGGIGLWYAPTQAVTPITNSKWDGLNVVAVNGTATPVVVGRGAIHATNTEIGYRWMNGDLDEIDPLPGGESTSPYAVSADGRTVVGIADGSNAFIWTDPGGTRTVVDELKARGYEPPSDLQLQNAFFTSDDGKIIVGDDFFNTPMFWRVILD